MITLGLSLVGLSAEMLLFRHTDWNVVIGANLLLALVFFVVYAVGHTNESGF